MHRHATIPIRERILSRFEEPIPGALVEFSKHVSGLQTDYVICMARKAARLLDLLMLAQCSTPPRTLSFHHVLDQDLSRYKGKSITLVDDTLILGTTLGHAERLLREAGAASVSSVVLAADTDHWDKTLVSPSQIFLKLPHDAILTFCSAEVQTLSTFGIPYLTDFPLTTDLRMTRPAFDRMQSIGRWETVPIRIGSSEGTESFCFSTVPVDAADSAIERAFGENIARLVNLTKVRIYSRRTPSSGYWTRFVPIATLAPMNTEAIEKLFEFLITTIERATGRLLSSIRSDLLSPIAKLRLSQYILSATIGRSYLTDLTKRTDLKRELDFSADEASKLFGPWLRKDIGVCHDAVGSILESGLSAPSRTSSIKSTNLPIEVAELSRVECAEFISGPSDKPGTPSGSRTLRTDLERIFLRLHAKHEIPAREEVKRFGDRVFSVPAADAPHRNRLKFGFDWHTIANCVLDRESLKPSPRRLIRLSFILDALIDSGIAVPVLCERDGVLFRAYRHGEDVPFANQEFALAFDVASGFIEGSKGDSIPRLIFEKLLVSLIRIGVAKKFMYEIHGRSGMSSGIARIGFHLHGAVATMPTDDSLLADHQESWLSRFLVDQGVITRKKGGSYQPGERPEAALISSSSSGEARQIGYLIGQLHSERDNAGTVVLSEQDLTILATCTRPRDAALAIAAELNIILRGTSTLPRRLDESHARARQLRQELTNSLMYTAMHSARMKYVAYKGSRPTTIVEKCESHLRATNSNPIVSNYWRGLWDPILALSDTGQKERFDPWIEKCMGRVVCHAQDVFTIELALASQATLSGLKEDKDAFDRTCDKIGSYLGDVKDVVVPSPLSRRLIDICQSKQPISHTVEALRFGASHAEKDLIVSRAALNQILEVARDYGRTDERVVYQYSLWYDVIDSTGQKSGLTGDALRWYRQRVRNFKERMVVRLEGLIIDARRRDIEIYTWANSLTSKDDEKNVFFRGPRSLDMLKMTIEILLNEARAARVRIRTLAIDTRFAGGPAHKYSSDPNVEGESFWEHGSRLKQGLKKLEVAELLRASYLWFGGDFADLAERLFDDKTWQRSISRGEIDTTIENFPLSTPYAGGPWSTM